MITKELIEAAIALAKSTNATENTMSFCHMKKLDNWCLRVTVCKHSVCEEKEQPPRERGGEVNKIYWTKECHPEKWDVGESFYFPLAHWFAHRYWGIAILKKYLEFRLWLRK